MNATVEAARRVVVARLAWRGRCRDAVFAIAAARCRVLRRSDRGVDLDFLDLFRKRRPALALLFDLGFVLGLDVRLAFGDQTGTAENLHDVSDVPDVSRCVGYVDSEIKTYKALKI